MSDIPDFQTTMTDNLSRDFRKNLLSHCKRSQACFISSIMTNITPKDLSWKDLRSDFHVNRPCSGVPPPPVGGQVTIPFNFA